MRNTSSSWQAMNSTRKRRYENPPPGHRDLDYKGLRGVVGADCNNDGSGEEYDGSEEEIDGSEEEYDGSGEEIGGSGEDDADFVNNTDLNVEYGGLGDVELVQPAVQVPVHDPVQVPVEPDVITQPEVEDNQWEIPDDILDAHWHQVDLHTGGNAGAQQGMTSKGKAVKAPTKDRRKKLPIRKSCGILGILLLELNNGSRNCYFVYFVNVANMYLGGEVAVFEVVVPSNQNAYGFGSTLAVFGSFEVNTF
nr:uncharacterized protein LOC109190938 [Ipomoea batatas]